MKRKTNLVCQHLENISGKLLEKFPLLFRAHARRRHGVYALYRKNRLYYVGLASNLRSRVRRHLQDRHAGAWDRFSIYFTIGDDHLRELESLAIRIASPKGNRQKGRFPKSQDLRRVLRQEIAEFQRIERDTLFEVSEKKLQRIARRIVEGRTPVLSEHAQNRGPMRIRWRYKGRLYRARVRQDGRIRLRGKLYTSPSKAAEAIAHHGVDGWYVWRYERAPGDWVLLNELRR